MINWMVYAALIGVLIAAGALALDRLMSSTGRPRRFVWLAALALAVAVPVAGGLRESPELPVGSEVVATESISPSTIELKGGQGRTPSLPLPDSRTAVRTATLAWAAGSVAALAAFFAVLCFVTRARRRWKLNRIDGTEVYVSDRFGPALVGILTPKIVVPTWVLELDPVARATILRHEQEHARAYDHLALLSAGLVAALFPWSPAIWWMCRRLRAAVEMDCDQRVIAGGIGAADYGAVLLQAGSRPQGRWGLAPAMGRPGSLLERRLRTMSEKKRKPYAPHGGLLAAAALVALGVACDVTSPTSLEEAIREVVADGQASEDIQDDARLAEQWYDRISRAFRSKAPTGTPPPIMFVDGRRVSNSGEAPDRTDFGRGGPSVSPVPMDFKRVQVLMDSAAREVIGEKAPGGVLRIFTSEDGGLTLEEVVAAVESVSGMPGILKWSYAAGPARARTIHATGRPVRE